MHITGFGSGGFGVAGNCSITGGCIDPVDPVDSVDSSDGWLFGSTYDSNASIPYYKFNLERYGGIHKPCGQERGEAEFPKKTCLSTWGEGGLEACPRGQKLFCGDSFFE